MGLLVVSILVQAWLISTKRIPLSSDQAIVCLMAKHILERGEHPIFYYGSAYAGSLEPHYVAGVFALFGKSPASYRVATGGLVLLMLIGVYAIARQAFGSLAAILALAYLAVPPFFFLYKGLTSDGHYDAFNLFVVGVVLVCIRIENSLASGADLRRLLIGLGFIFGLGWWINPITPPISAAAVVWLFLRKGHPPIRQAAWLVVGFPAGSAPWFYWNVHHGWASLAMPELRHVSVGGALHNLAEVFRHSIPLLVGGMRFRMATSWNTFPLSSTLVLAALIIIVMLGIRRALSGDRVLRLLFLCFLLLVATVIWSTRYVPGEPRVLFPYYVLTPPVIGLGLATLARRGTAGRLLAVLLGGFLLFAHATSLAVEYRHLRNTETEVTADLGSLQDVLRREGVRHAYTDYWTAYRLSFESNERIIAAPIPGDEAVRYLPYQEAVAADASAAIVMRGDRANCLETYLRERGLPYLRSFAPPYSAFTRLPPEIVRFIGENGGLPLPDEAYRVDWRLGPHPQSIPRGETTRVTVSFRNVSSCSWPHAVHVGYHWMPKELGLPEVWDGGRALPDRRIEPGQSVTLAVDLKAPETPGRYSLAYDLVFEKVTWFSSKGGVMTAVPIVVR